MPMSASLAVLRSKSRGYWKRGTGFRGLRPPKCMLRCIVYQKTSEVYVTCNPVNAVTVRSESPILGKSARRP